MEILSCDEFSPLKVLVLLLAWPFCHTCDAAQTLLDSLWDQQVSNRIKSTLHYHCSSLPRMNKLLPL